MNKVFLYGNLTRDVELKHAPSTAFGRTGIAVHRRGKKDEVDFFNLVAFGKTAETMAKYLTKGRRIAVEGQLRYVAYEDKNGEKKTAVDVVVDNFEFADSKKSSGARDKDFGGEQVDEEDYPF